MSNHCSECRADDDSPHYPECSSYRPPTQQELSERDDRIGELEAELAATGLRTCGNCKHWVERRNNAGSSKRTCDAISSAWLPDDRAVIQSSEDMHDLTTAADFGCVLFEAKEEA